MSDDRVTRGIDDFAAWAGLSRRTVYRMITDGQIRTKKIGGRRLVIVASYMEMIEKRPYHRSRKNGSPDNSPAPASSQSTADAMSPIFNLLSLESIRALRFRKSWSPQEIGVYFLFNRGQLQYVGQSIGISNRIVAHRSAKKITFDEWVAIPCETHDLDLMEAAYIRRYSPPHNVGRRGRTHSSTHKQMARRGTRAHSVPPNLAENTRCEPVSS